MNQNPYSDPPATFNTQVSWDLDIPNSPLTVQTHACNMVFTEILDFKEGLIRDSLIQLGWTPPQNPPQ